MAHEIRVPRLGWSMEEGTFIAWLKTDGEEVKVGEPLYELEGEKSLQQVESVDAGILRIPPDAPGSGETVLVGALLGYLAGPDDLAPWKQARAAVVAETPVSIAADAKSAGTIESATSTTAASPRGNGRRVASTPRARRVAAELGIDWTTLEGTGAGGRIRESDVRLASRSAGNEPPGGWTSTRPSSRRRVIGERMLTSQQRNAPVTLTTRADATNLVALRNRFKSAGDGKAVPSYTDLVAQVVARVLPSHRALAGCWNAARDRILVPNDDAIHIGIAVDTPDGLVVPVLRSIAARDASDLAEHSRELVERARTGRLSAAEQQGSVFTVTSLGAYGIDAFTPIINDPEAAILGLGAIRREAVVLEDGTIGPRDQITLSLTFDHIRIDGAPAARFLQDVRVAIESVALT